MLVYFHYGMSYSSTNPRPVSSWTTSGKRVRQYSLDAIQKESTLDYGSVRQSVPSSKLPKYDTRTVITVTRLRYDNRTHEYEIGQVDLTTAQILSDPSILPYGVYPSTYLNSSLRAKLTQYAIILGGYVKYRPKFYFITRYFLCDDLGRHYRINDYGFLEFISSVKLGKRYPINFGDGRSERSITRDIKTTTSDSITLKLALYTWNGIAGLTAESQARIISSRGFDVHHGDENLFDIRPQALFPIPSFLHRYIHGEYHSYSDLRKFFDH